MSPGVLGAVVNAQSGELTALLGGGAPDEAAVVDPVSLPIPPRRDRRPLSGSVSAADIIALAQDRRVGRRQCTNASIARSSPPNGDDLAFVQLALSDPASANKREGPGVVRPRVGWRL